MRAPRKTKKQRQQEAEFFVKPFLLFTGAAYYPTGGWGDFRGCFETVEKALETAASLVDDWWQVVDIRSKEQVSAGKSRLYGGGAT